MSTINIVVNITSWPPAGGGLQWRTLHHRWRHRPSTHLRQLGFVAQSIIMIMAMLGGVNGVDQSPQEDGHPQHQPGEDRAHDGDQEIDEEGDEGPADEDDGGEDDHEHVGHQPRYAVLGFGWAGAEVEEDGEGAVDDVKKDEDRVHQGGVTGHPSQRWHNLSGCLKKGNVNKWTTL